MSRDDIVQAASGGPDFTPKDWPPAPDAGLRVGRITTGRVLWPAGANWSSGKREVIIELRPIGPDGNCTGCGAKPTRETGSCRCLPHITAALSRQAEKETA